MLNVSFRSSNNFTIVKQEGIRPEHPAIEYSTIRKSVNANNAEIKDLYSADKDTARRIVERTQFRLKGMLGELKKTLIEMAKKA